MNWETVKISSKSRGKTSAYASVGFGRISLSYGACALVEDFPKYKYAQILRARKDGKLCIGIRLLVESAENTIRISKRKIKGELIEYSGSIDSKPLVEELFGIEGAQNKATRHSVVLDDTEKNILVIYGEYWRKHNYSGRKRHVGVILNDKWRVISCSSMTSDGKKRPTYTLENIDTGRQIEVSPRAIFDIEAGVTTVDNVLAFRYWGRKEWMSYMTTEKAKQKRESKKKDWMFD